MSTRTTPRTTDHTHTNGYGYDADLEALLDTYPPKMEPMPDGAEQQPHLLRLLWALLSRYEAMLRKASIFADIFVYYREGDRNASVAPDLIVAFDVDPEDVMRERSYLVWRAEKPPDLALEIGSPSTARRDLTEKRELYARIGISEYWMFDATGGEYYGFALRGWRLVDGEYQQIEAVEGADGSIRCHSEVLGLDICWEGGEIRLYDPEVGEYLLDRTQIESALRSAKERAEYERTAWQAERVARLAAEERAARQRAARQAERAARQAERTARQAAETRAEAAESEVEMLREMLRRHGQG